ncbi:kinase-like domain-containing protein [Mycena capillaripes]|nr:kinase-like domain-containing protein [Mycena capillaripes]
MAKVILNLTARTVDWDDDVLEEISRLGESGAVHKVKDKRTGKIMVRKTNTALGSKSATKRFLSQLSIISSLEHMNIILFHGTYMPSPHEVKILLEYCEGSSLEAVGKRIKERNAIVGENVAGFLAEGILQGLAYLDTQKIIHGSIKPSGILFSREGIVKLSDFDLPCEVTVTFTADAFLYKAPERLLGQKYTIRSDVWSTGICLLELVQNRYPFPSDLPIIEAMMYITAGDPPRLEDEPGRQWSNEIKDFFKQTLTVDALTRPTPSVMLAHPLVVDAIKQPDQMAGWIRNVWGWPGDSSSSSRSDSLPSSGAHTESPHVSSESPPQT